MLRLNMNPKHTIVKNILTPNSLEIARLVHMLQTCKGWIENWWIFPSGGLSLYVNTKKRLTITHGVCISRCYGVSIKKVHHQLGYPIKLLSENTCRKPV